MLAFKGHKERVTGLAFSPDGRYLASVAYDGTLCLWDTIDGTGGQLTHIRAYPYGNLQHIAFSPDGHYLVARFPIVGLQVWDVAARALTRALLGDSGYVGGQTVALSPAGDQVVANRLSAEGDVLLRWDARTWEELAPGPTLNYGRRAYGRVAFDPTGRRLATCFGPIFDTTTWAEVGRLSQVRGTRLAWAPDSRLLATGGDNRKIVIWEVATSREVQALAQERKFFTDFTFTPDGRHLLTVSNEEKAQMWDVATWRAREALDWKVGKLRAVAVSPDGMRAAAGAQNGRIVIWDLD